MYRSTAGHVQFAIHVRINYSTGIYNKNLQIKYLTLSTN